MKMKFILKDMKNKFTTHSIHLNGIFKNSRGCCASSLRLDPRITALRREMPRLGISPNFVLRTKLLLSAMLSNVLFFFIQNSLRELHQNNDYKIIHQFL